MLITTNTNALFLTGFFIFPASDSDLETIKSLLNKSELQFVTNMDLGYLFLEETFQFREDSKMELEEVLGRSAKFQLIERF